MHDHLRELLRCWEAVEERFFPGAKCSTNYYVRSLDEAIHRAVNEPPDCEGCIGLESDLLQALDEIHDKSEEISGLEDTIEDLRNQLHDARSESNALRDHIAELKRELQEVRCDS